MRALQRASCRKGPARAAVSLVLDGGHGASSHPVHGIGIHGSVEHGWLLADVVRALAVAILSFDLMGMPVGEFVVAEHVVRRARIVCLDESISFHKDTEARIELCAIRKLLVEFSDIVHVLEFSRVESINGAHGENKCEGLHLFYCIKY